MQKRMLIACTAGIFLLCGAIRPRLNPMKPSSGETVEAVSESSVPAASAHETGQERSMETAFVSSISPASGKKGTRFPVTIRGGDFQAGMIPYSKTWGVSFVQVKVIDASTLTALALVHDLAPPGMRKIAVAFPPNTSSGTLDFTVMKNEALPAPEYGFGMYEDFEDRSGDGFYDAGYGSWYNKQDDLRRLVWWSPGHDQTYAALTQEEGRLKMFTEYDGERGYWNSLRLAQPEGYVLGERSMLRLARSLSADFTIPRTDLRWRDVGIGMMGRYHIPEDEHMRWTLIFHIMGHDKKEGPYYEYYIDTYGNHLPHVTDVHGAIWEPEFRYDTRINLRYDLFVMDGRTMVVDLFIDDVLKARLYPRLSDYFLNQCPWDRGPVRLIQVGTLDDPPGFTVYMDNVRSAYPLVRPPVNFKVERRRNDSLLQREYINVLSWETNPARPYPPKYEIYRVEDGALTFLTEYENGDAMEYRIRGVRGDRTYRYAIKSVFPNGFTSDLVYAETH